MLLWMKIQIVLMQYRMITNIKLTHSEESFHNLNTWQCIMYVTCYSGNTGYK